MPEEEFLRAQVVCFLLIQGRPETSPFKYGTLFTWNLRAQPETPFPLPPPPQGREAEGGETSSPPHPPPSSGMKQHTEALTQRF